MSSDLLLYFIERSLKLVNFQYNFSFFFQIKCLMGPDSLRHWDGRWGQEGRDRRGRVPADRQPSRREASQARLKPDVKCLTHSKPSANPEGSVGELRVRRRPEGKLARQKSVQELRSTPVSPAFSLNISGQLCRIPLVQWKWFLNAPRV